MNYKTKFAEQVSELIAHTRSGNLPRDLRIQAVESMTEAYVLANGEQPDATQLERLADALLHEELTDRDRMKARNTEYPFLSEWQYDQRTRRDVKEGASTTVATSGKDYRTPVRRQRSNYENNFVNKVARSKNRERKRKYNEFTKDQPIEVGAMQPEDVEAYLTQKYTKWKLRHA